MVSANGLRENTSIKLEHFVYLFTASVVVSKVNWCPLLCNGVLCFSRTHVMIGFYWTVSCSLLMELPCPDIISSVITCLFKFFNQFEKLTYMYKIQAGLIKPKLLKLEMWRSLSTILRLQTTNLRLTLGNRYH